MKSVILIGTALVAVVISLMEMTTRPSQTIPSSAAILIGLVGLGFTFQSRKSVKLPLLAIAAILFAIAIVLGIGQIASLLP